MAKLKSIICNCLCLQKNKTQFEVIRVLQKLVENWSKKKLEQKLKPVLFFSLCTFPMNFRSTLVLVHGPVFCALSSLVEGPKRKSFIKVPIFYFQL